jgi:Gelsolin repeat
MYTNFKNHVNNLILQVTEVFNFSQDDLLTEDMLILDSHAEVFVWIGQLVDPKEKQKAFDVGQVESLFIYKSSLELGINYLKVESDSNQ